MSASGYLAWAQSKEGFRAMSDEEEAWANRPAAPPELAERALMIELATQMALAAGYAPHCWPTWEQEATVIIPTIAKHAASAIATAWPFIEAQERARVANWLRETAPQLGHEALADAIEQGMTP